MPMDNDLMRQESAKIISRIIECIHRATGCPEGVVLHPKTRIADLTHPIGDTKAVRQLFNELEDEFAIHWSHNDLVFLENQAFLKEKVTVRKVVEWTTGRVVRQRAKDISANP